MAVELDGISNCETAIVCMLVSGFSDVPLFNIVLFLQAKDHSFAMGFINAHFLRTNNGNGLKHIPTSNIAHVLSAE